MKRRWLAAALLSALLLPAGARAIALDGNVLNQSQLGEPLHALIPVLLGAGESASDVQGHLEGPAAYAERGVPYPADLARVSLDVISVGGKPYLRISGERPMQEPAIQLLVWISARGVELHREYDVLLDPPGSPRGLVIGEARDDAPAATSAEGMPPVPVAQEQPPPARHRARAAVAAAVSISPPAVAAAGPSPAWPRSLRLTPPPIDMLRWARSWTRRSALAVPALRLAAALGEAGAVAAAPQSRLPPSPSRLDATRAVNAPLAAPRPSAPTPRWPWMLAFLAAAVGLLMVLARRRRGASGAEAPAVPAAVVPAPAPLALAPSLEAPPPEAQTGRARAIAQERAFSQGEAGTIVASADEQSPEKAQDFYSDVAGLLRSVIDHEPNRRDLHLKLLEVYFSAGQVQAFVDETRVYLALLKGAADEQWPAIVRMGRQIAPEAGLYLDRPPAVQRAPKGSASSIAATPGPALAASAPAHAYKRHYDGVNQAALSPRFAELDAAADRCFKSAEFQQALKRQMHAAQKEPLPSLRHTRHLVGGRKAAQLYGMTGAMNTHADERVSNAIGQVSLARAMGKDRVVASGDDLAHATAVAIAAAQNAMACSIYVDADKFKAFDAERVQRLRDLGADIVGPQDPRWQAFGTARQSALTDWVDSHARTLYVSGLDAGPSPYPRIVRHFQSWIGAEIRERFAAEINLTPAAVVVGRTDDYFALGVLHAFLDTLEIKLYCVDAPMAQRRGRGHRFQREHSWLASSQRVAYPEVDEAAARLVMDTAGLNEDWSVDVGAARTVSKAIEVARTLAAHRAVLAVHITSVDAEAEAAPELELMPGG